MSPQRELEVSPLFEHLQFSSILCSKGNDIVETPLWYLAGSGRLAASDQADWE